MWVSHPLKLKYIYPHALWTWGTHSCQINVWNSSLDWNPIAHGSFKVNNSFHLLSSSKGIVGSCNGSQVDRFSLINACEMDNAKTDPPFSR